MGKRSEALTIDHETTDPIGDDDAPCTALQIAARRDPVALFAEGEVVSLLDRIRKEIRSIRTDISTPQGRAFIKSTAYQLSKRKVWLDNLGKDLTEAERQKIERVNAERKIWREEMAALQEEFRKPLTDWERADEARVAAHAEAVNRIEQLTVFTEADPTVEAIEDRLAELGKILERDWHEFAQRAVYLGTEAQHALDRQLAAAVRRRDDAIELAKLRAERVERDRIAGHQAALENFTRMTFFAEGTGTGANGAVTAADCAVRIAVLQKPGIRDWEEFADEAEKLRAEAISFLEGLRANLEFAEAEVQRERERQAAEAAAEAERAASAERERLAAEKAAQDLAEANARAAAAEKSRVDQHISALTAIKVSPVHDLDAPLSSIEVEQRIARLTALYDRDWQEFADDAKQSHDHAAECLADLLQAAQDREAAQKALADRQRQVEEQQRQQQAVEADRKRAAEEAKRIADEQARAAAQREANIKHKQRINREALADMVAAGIDETVAKVAIEAIARRIVRHIAITY